MKVTLEKIYEAVQALSVDFAEFKNQVDRRFIDQFSYLDTRMNKLETSLQNFATKEDVNRALTRMDSQYAWLDTHEPSWGRCVAKLPVTKTGFSAS